jgi:hypothetical protein
LLACGFQYTENNFTCAFLCCFFTSVTAGKGGWTAERKYELDSGAYFINLLHNYMHSPGMYDPERLLMEPVLHDAVLLMLKVGATAAAIAPRGSPLSATLRLRTTWRSVAATFP